MRKARKEQDAGHVARKLPKTLQPQGKLPLYPTFHQRPFRWLIKHMLFKRFRRRLVCPNCGVVGTWKPYGYWWKDRNVRRWLCKWCGFYDGVDGRYWCVINVEEGCWVTADGAPEGSTTPQKIAEQHKFNPWAG